jgi:hypothetical protein
MRLDIHSIIHFVGSYALALTFFVWGVPLYWLWVFGLGVAWELLDTFVDAPWLDSRGGDLIDLLVDGLGVALAVGVVSL